MEDQLPADERKLLLALARDAIHKAVNGQTIPPINLSAYSERLQQPGATFVTLTKREALRGCIGALEAYQPLVEDVRQHAIAAALEDYRFSPVKPEELPDLNIEISRLTRPETLNYAKPDELLYRLRPGIDGVIIADGNSRATFLPQVWEKVPNPADFLDHLCMKMGASSNLWRRKKLSVRIYQVEEFHE